MVLSASVWIHVTCGTAGDLATIDVHGYISIVDRKKDMILSGGENVYSTEVSSCLKPCLKQDWKCSVDSMTLPAQHAR